MDRIVNNNWLAWKLVWMLRIYRIYNLTLGFQYMYNIYLLLIHEIFVILI